VPLQLSDARLELGYALVLLPALLPPPVPNPLLELDRALEDTPVLGLDPGSLRFDTPFHHPTVYRAPRTRKSRGAAPAQPTTDGSATSARGPLVGAFDLDAPGLLYSRSASDPHLEHAVQEAGTDIALVRALRQ
jgi:hypothetical protein